MTDAQKRIAVISLAVVALAAAVYSGMNAMSQPKEKIVGTLPMPEGGGRDSEKAKPASATEAPVADVASGMPADMINPK